MTQSIGSLSLVAVRHKGMALIEFLSSLMIGSLMLAGIVSLVNWYLDTIKQNSAADYQAKLVTTAENYVRDNYVDLVSNLENQSAIAISLEKMQKSGFGTNLASSNIYGNTPCLLVGKNADQPSQILALLVLAGGQSISEIDLGMIATLSGPASGFIPDRSALLMAKAKFTDPSSLNIEAGYKKIGIWETVKTDVAYGPFSGWALSTRHFRDKNCGDKNFKSRLASLVRVNPDLADPDFLSRVAGGKASTMNTDLNLNKNKILNINVLSVDYPKIQESIKPGHLCDGVETGSIFFDEDKSGLVICKRGVGSIIGIDASEYIKMVAEPGALTWREAEDSDFSLINGRGPVATAYCLPNEVIEFVRSSCTRLDSGLVSMYDKLYTKDLDIPVTTKRPLILENIWTNQGTIGSLQNGVYSYTTGPGWSTDGVRKDRTDYDTFGWGVDLESEFSGEVNKSYGYFNSSYLNKWAAIVKGVWVEGWKVSCNTSHAYVGLACRAVGKPIPETKIRIDPTKNSYDYNNQETTRYLPSNEDIPKDALPVDGIIRH